MNAYDAIFLQAMDNQESIQENEDNNIQKGKILSQSDNGYFVALGGKSEMILPLTETVGTISVGDEVEIVYTGMRDGIPQVSQKKAQRVHTLELLHQSAEQQTPVSAKIIRVLANKESKNVGYMVSINGIEAFLPFSHVMVPKNETDLIGKEIKVVVLKIERDRVSVSERIIRDRLQKENFAQFVAQHNIGDKLNVTVESVNDSFALVSAEGITMFLHITQFDWKYVKNLNNVLKVGDTIDVLIDSIDTAKKSIKVSRKSAIENPIVSFLNSKRVGDVVTAQVARFARGLAILETDSGVEMLLPVFEMSWIKRVSDPKQLLNLGDRVEVKIKDIDMDRQRISVSLKELLQNPWSQVEKNYAFNTVHQGVVSSITDFGVFITLEDGIQGLIRREDVDWNNPDIDLVERFKKGDKVSAVVLHVDASQERLRLGIKQLEENPFKEFVQKNPVGTLVSGVVKSINKDGVDVELQNEFPAFIHISQLSVENVTDPATICSIGDTIQAVVRRINMGQQKLELSIKEIALAEEKQSIAQVMNAQKQETPNLGSILGDALKNTKL